MRIREALYVRGDLIRVKEPVFVDEDIYYRIGVVIHVGSEIESPFYNERYYDAELYREHPELYKELDEPFEYVPLYLVYLHNGVKEQFFDEEIELVSSYLQP
jgi:hypothetical protein